EDKLTKDVLKSMADSPKKSLKNTLIGIVPNRLLVYIRNKNDVVEEQKTGNVSKEAVRATIHDMIRFTFEVHGSLPMEKAFVTGGGVSIKEIVPNTMQSKKMHNLYFCGEILDIHGYTGGYNITSALVTGRLAGMNAARDIGR